MRIHFYDRSGAQISSPLDCHHDFQVIVDIVHMFAHANRALLGYDLTIDIFRIPSIPQQVRPTFNFIGTVQGVDSEVCNIFELLWSSPGFIERGTVCWHVRPEITGPSKANEGFLDDSDYVLKDSWVDQSQVDHELDILKHINGIEGVLVLINSWTVQFRVLKSSPVQFFCLFWAQPVMVASFIFLLIFHRILSRASILSNHGICLIFPLYLWLWLSQ